MVAAKCRTVRAGIGSVGFVLLTVVPLCGAPPADKDTAGPSGTARLKFMQQLLRDMQVESTDGGDVRELKFQMTPLLRYSDTPRGVSDSAIWRLGTRGRPVAIVTSELYGQQDRQFTLCHEFLAIDDPRLCIQRDSFKWQPPKAALSFQPLKTDSPPADNARTRLAQFKRLAGRFSVREEWRGSKIELRMLPTPIDRYVPSDNPNADAAIFACVWGVNPEALLFLETDGTATTFAWARLGAAAVKAELDDKTVWEVPLSTESEQSTAPYTFIHRTVNVPLANQEP